MILGVGIVARIPREFLGEDHLALVERGNLEIARAKVKTDTATVGNRLDERRLLVHFRHLRERHNHRLYWAAVDRSEEVVVERADALLGIGLGDRLDDRVGTGKIQLPTAGGPYYKLGDTLDDISNIIGSIFVETLRNGKIVAEHLAVFTLPRYCHHIGLRADSVVNRPQGLHRSHKLMIAV